MLTDEETPKVIAWLKAYPAGAGAHCWGIGPLNVTDITDLPDSQETLMEFG